MIMEKLCYDENNKIKYKNEEYLSVFDLPREAVIDYFSDYYNVIKATGGTEVDFSDPLSFDKSILEASIEIQNRC